MAEGSDLRWGIERRLEFIEFRLFWDGHVNRADLMDTFAVSVNQASADLNRYIAMAPDNMAYDKSARTYVRCAAFTPLFLKPDASRYLSQLRSVADGILDRSDAWIGQFPAYEATPTPVRGVNAKTLRSVVAAIRRAEAIEIRYQSLSQPEPRWRWIAPHAIAFDGFRWHARAFCETDKTFKDFVLSRVLDVGAARSPEVASASDLDWNSHVEIVIAPHPGLSVSQRTAIELDYAMVQGRAVIAVRRALLYYTLRRLGLDTDPAARTPKDQQIVLLETREIAS